MKTIREQIDAHLAAGYRSDTANAKVAHDIVTVSHATVWLQGEQHCQGRRCDEFADW